MLARIQQNLENLGSSLRRNHHWRLLMWWNWHLEMPDPILPHKIDISQRVFGVYEGADPRQLMRATYLWNRNVQNTVQPQGLKVLEVACCGKATSVNPRHYFCEIGGRASNGRGRPAFLDAGERIDRTARGHGRWDEMSVAINDFLLCHRIHLCCQGAEKIRKLQKEKKRKQKARWLFRSLLTASSCWVFGTWFLGPWIHGFDWGTIYTAVQRTQSRI